MKPLFCPALLREQLKRFWAIAALTMLFYMLFVFLPIYSSDGITQARDMASLLSSGGAANVALFIAPFAAVISLFSYLFSPSATTFFHALPTNKNQLLCTNMLAGFILTLMPLIALCLLILIPIYAPMEADLPSWQSLPWINGYRLTEGELINTVSRVAAFFLQSAIVTISFFVLFVLAATLAGTGAIAIILCVFLPFLPATVYGVIYMFAVEHFAFSFYNDHEVWRFFDDFFMTLDWGALALRTAILLPITHFCYHKRRLERTGDTIVFHPFKNFLIFLFSVWGMILMGTAFEWMFGDNAVYLGFVLGFPTAFIILQMIMEKTFQIRHKFSSLLTFGGIAAALYFVLFIISLIT